MRICTIKELKQITLCENGEPLIDLREITDDIISTGLILIREGVAKKLLQVQERLKKHHGNYNLMVSECYRHPFRQEEAFIRVLFEIIKKYPDRNLEHVINMTHQFIALPTVAGHPTGGAVDVTLYEDGQEVDMGGEIADFTNPEILPTYSTYINSRQAKNRQVLHDLMLEARFAPFYGEWWHFSYGDREWASFYKQPCSLYSPIFIP